MGLLLEHTQILKQSISKDKPELNNKTHTSIKWTVVGQEPVPAWTWRIFRHNAWTSLSTSSRHNFGYLHLNTSAMWLCLILPPQQELHEASSSTASYKSSSMWLAFFLSGRSFLGSHHHPTGVSAQPEELRHVISLLQHRHKTSATASSSHKFGTR